MTTYYVDTSQPTNGSGSQVSPFNTLASVVTAAGDMVLLKAGTTVPASTVPAGFMTPSGLTIGAYGTGDRPIISGGINRSGWTFDGVNSVWSKAYASNVVGNITEDGAPMRFVPWAANLAASAALMTAGSFCFDYNGFVLYIKPSAGSANDHQYVVSESLYGLSSGTANTGLAIFDLDIRSISRHSLVLANKKNFRLEGISVSMAGGIRDPSFHLGNGFELAVGSNNGDIVDCEFYDIFDSAVTSQLYEGSSAIVKDHRYKNLIAKRCGMSGVEISTQTANQVISNIYLDGLLAEDMGVNCWAGDRGGDAFRFVNNGGASSVITACVMQNIQASRVRRLYVTSNTNGVNFVLNAKCTAHQLSLAASNGTSITDVWSMVSGDAGVVPTGGKFLASPGYRNILNTGVYIA